MKLIFSSVIILIIALTSCTHNIYREEVKPAIVYDFSYSGSLCLGETISFVSTAPYSSTFLWKFGDGSTSSLPAPTHVYSIVPYWIFGKLFPTADTVSLMINNDTAHTIVKIIKLSPGAQRFAGTYNWTGGYLSLYGGCCIGMTSHALNDTTFSIAALNDSTISVWGTVLPFVRELNRFTTERTNWHDCSKLRFNGDTLFFADIDGGLGGGISIVYYALR